MKSIMAITPHESSFSFSRRHFHRIIARVEGAAGNDEQQHVHPQATNRPLRGAVNRLRSALAAAMSARTARSVRVRPRIMITIYGPRQGHMRLAFQVDPPAGPPILVELAIPTASFVKEMASGLVRIALECEQRNSGGKVRLVEERQWRAYCNGRKCGYAVRREGGDGDSRVLGAVEMVSMGAGVLPPAMEGGGAPGGEVMYMRARFERVVGSKDSEAFYMMGPDGGRGGEPELSIFLHRV